MVSSASRQRCSALHMYLSMCARPTSPDGCRIANQITYIGRDLEQCEPQHVSSGQGRASASSKTYTRCSAHRRSAVRYITGVAQERALAARRSWKAPTKKPIICQKEAKITPKYDKRRNWPPPRGRATDKDDMKTAIMHLSHLIAEPRSDETSHISLSFALHILLFL